MKLLRDESLNPTLLGNKQSIGGLKNGRWVAYVRFIRSQSKIVDVIMTILNVIWTVQVPMEMLLTRLVSLPLKMQIIAFYEIIK